MNACVPACILVYNLIIHIRSRCEGIFVHYLRYTTNSSKAFQTDESSELIFLGAIHSSVTFIACYGVDFMLHYMIELSSLNPSLLQLQLLSTLGLFDIMGSTAYALTTLPTPESDKLLGAKGNKKPVQHKAF